LIKIIYISVKEYIIVIDFKTNSGGLICLKSKETKLT